MESSGKFYQAEQVCRPNVGFGLVQTVKFYTLDVGYKLHHLSPGLGKINDRIYFYFLLSVFGCFTCVSYFHSSPLFAYICGWTSQPARIIKYQDCKTSQEIKPGPKVPNFLQLVVFLILFI